ncbi:MAG TPA: PspC domain-containing protein [Gaiellaceae bacterium]|jgi:phage shock protein PspC (stress-responsive transcriptional regulator)|nr:PspC domain-containing protein [Gaiellaceae bacterium]
MNTHIAHPPQVKRLERTKSPRMIAGVCGGLGRYFGLSPAVFRLGLVVLTLLGGAGILVYLAAVLVIPEEGADQSFAERVLSERRDRPWPLIGLGLVGVAIAVLLAHAAAGAGWVLVLIAGLIVLWMSRREKKGRGIVIAVVALTGVIVAAIATATVVAFAWFNVSLGDGVGNHVYEPTSISAVRPQYKLGVGDLRIDLSNIGPVTTTTHVDASVGVGELHIVVPRNAAVAVNARAKAGEMFILRRHDSGRDAAVRVGQGPLVIDAQVGAGRIDVVRAG